MNQHSSSTKKYYSILIGVALLAASLFHFSRPIFAAGTAAGQKLRNTATGSYTDDAGKNYTIESNTVEVTVARVAGITNQPLVITNESNPADPILTGNRVSFTFEVTNVGNDVSNIFIPGLGNITTNGVSRSTSGDNEDNLVIQVSPALDADGNLASDGTTPFSFGNIPTGSAAIPDSRADNTNGNGEVENIPANGKVLVKITGTVTATGQNATIQARLGHTDNNLDPNAPLPNTQNQPDANNGDPNDDQNQDVRTTEPTTPSANGGSLVGEQKEASATLRTVLGANPLAMAHIGKVRGTPVPNTNALNDDVIPYSLKLEVRGTSESPVFTPGALEGRSLPNVETTGPNVTSNANLILVSDAIPEFTNLESEPGTPNADWTPVYNYQDPNNVLPKDAVWTETAPVANTNPDGSDDNTVNNELRDVTRIGWVYDARPGANGPIAAGTTNIPTFDFQVVTADLPGGGGTIANIAQVFGTTDDGVAGINGPVVFDESGDQDASNFTGENQGPDEDDAQSTGVADPANHDEDDNNDNTGDPNSPGGEDNTYIIGVPGEIVNGPRGKANATGNIFDEGPDNQHDFQNLGVNGIDDGSGGIIPVTATPTTDLDPAPITFENTFTYPSATGATALTDVKLQPIRPDFGDIGGENNYIPNDTTVDILYNGKTASYIYESTNNTDGKFRFIGNSNDAIEFPSLAPGSSIDYEVVVNLPSNTDFSTNINRGFPIPIVAFTDGDVGQDGVPDLDDNGTPLDTSDDFIVGGNVTVNQIYTGFVKIVKQVRVLQPDGTPRVGPAPGNVGMGFNDDDANKKPLPGDILEYRVIYRNISEAQAGNNSNVILNGINVNIDENGTADIADGNLDENANNWALDNDDNDTLDTLHVAGETADNNSNSTINYYIGSSSDGGNDTTLTELTSVGPTEPANTDEVTGYRNTISNLAPAGSEGTPPANPWEETVDAGDFSFTFQRKVEGFELP